MGTRPDVHATISKDSHIIKHHMISIIGYPLFNCSPAIPDGSPLNPTAAIVKFTIRL